MHFWLTNEGIPIGEGSIPKTTIRHLNKLQGPWQSNWNSRTGGLSYSKIRLFKNMKVSIHQDYDSMSQQAASEIILQIKQKPEAVLCFASGETPRQMCRFTVERAGRENIDFSRCTFIGLDEWVGIPPTNEGSCNYFFQKEVFGPLRLSADQIHVFDAMAKDLENECRKMDNAILRKGGIDLMVVGIGMNGHIGFNEPGHDFDQFSHVAELAEETRAVGQKYFRQVTALTKGLTLGLRHLMEARKLILLANGAKKAEVIRKALEEEVTPDFPASFVRNHANATVMLDEEAASLLTN